MKLKAAEEMTALAEGAGPPEKRMPTFLLPLYPFMPPWYEETGSLSSFSPEMPPRGFDGDGGALYNGGMDDYRDDGRCFVCGAANDAGLHLEFRLDGDAGTAEAALVIPDRFQGWAGVVHGGLLATVLDEALVKSAGARGLRCVTGEITVRYRRPSPVGAALTVRGRMLDRRQRMVTAAAEIVDAAGATLATASGKLFVV